MLVRVALITGLAVLSAGLILGAVQCLRGRRGGWWLSAIFGFTLTVLACLALVPTLWGLALDMQDPVSTEGTPSWELAATVAVPGAIVVTAATALVLLQLPTMRRYLDA